MVSKNWNEEKEENLTSEYGTLTPNWCLLEM